MRKIFLYVVALLLVNCEEVEQPKPANLIPKDKMQDLLYDIVLLQSIGSVDPTFFSENKFDSQQYIYQKYQIDSLQFVESNKYYASDIEQYEAMLDVVAERLKEQNPNTQKSTIQTPAKIEGLR